MKQKKEDPLVRGLALSLAFAVTVAFWLGVFALAGLVF